MTVDAGSSLGVYSSPLSQQEGDCDELAPSTAQDRLLQWGGDGLLRSEIPVTEVFLGSKLTCFCLVSTNSFFRYANVVH